MSHALFLLETKMLPQVPEGVEKVRLDRPDRTSEYAGNFFMRQFVVHPQDECGPLFRRQCRDGLAYQDTAFFAQHAIRGRFGPCVDVLARVETLSRRGLPADAVQ